MRIVTDRASLSINGKGMLKVPTQSPLHQMLVRKNGDVLLLFMDPAKQQHEMCQVYYVDMTAYQIRWQIQKGLVGASRARVYARLYECADDCMVAVDCEGRSFYVDLQTGRVKYADDWTGGETEQQDVWSVVINGNKISFNGSAALEFPTHSPIYEIMALDDFHVLVQFWDPMDKNEECQVYCVDRAQNTIRWQIQKGPFDDCYAGWYNVNPRPDGSVGLIDYYGRHYDLNLDDGSVTFTGEITK